MKKAVPLRGLLPALIFLALIFACKNPMVNYLLGEKEEEEDPSPVAFYDPPGPSAGVWYHSLAEALDAAEAASAPAANHVIQIRRDIKTQKTLGASSFTLPYKTTVNNVTLEPWTADTAFATVRRVSGGGPLFTINAGGSLTLKDCAVDGAGALTAVRVNLGGDFFLGDASSPGDAAFVPAGSAVYLETGAMITTKCPLTAPVIARITPQTYPAPRTPPHPARPSPGYTQVLDGAAIAGGSLDYEKFDVTPERPPSAAWDSPPAMTWESPRHWRVDSEGYLVHVAASHVNSAGQTKYYETLSAAIGAATGAMADPDTVTLIANIELNASDTFLINKFIRLTVPQGCRYIIKRTAPTTVPVFAVDLYCYLELGAPGGSLLTIDGGAVWNGGYPAAGAANTSGITSTDALVTVNGDNSDWGTFFLASGAVLQNNDRTGTGNGGGIESKGYFEIRGGVIRHNRSAGNGGGIAITMNTNDPSCLSGRGTISGGEISGNDAAKSGGGVMLYLQGGSVLTMTGGSINGNRAGGADPGGSVDIVNAFGGGIFIPHGNGYFRVNTFTMNGGTITGNISSGGAGNGIAMDLLSTAPTFIPQINLGGSARIADDICLHNHGSSPFAPLIRAAGFNHTPHITINLDDYTGVSLGIEVMDGPFNPSSFTAALPYYLRSDGAIWDTP